MMRQAATCSEPRQSPLHAFDRDEEAGRGSWLLCRTGTVRAAVPIEHVVEVMRVLPIEQVTGAPPYVRGLSIVRGLPAVIIDLGLMIGGGISRAARLVAVRAGERTVALAVDEVIGIATIGDDLIGELPPLLRDAGDTIAAIGALDSALLVLLETARLVSEDFWPHLAAAGARS
jgi:purine-binding chemotaxis protein CheW